MIIKQIEALIPWLKGDIGFKPADKFPSIDAVVTLKTKKKSPVKCSNDAPKGSFDIKPNDWDEVSLKSNVPVFLPATSTKFYERRLQALSSFEKSQNNANFV